MANGGHPPRPAKPQETKPAGKPAPKPAKSKKR